MGKRAGEKQVRKAAVIDGTMQKKQRGEGEEGQKEVEGVEEVMNKGIVFLFFYTL